MQVILRNDKNCSKLRVVFADVLNSLCLEIASQGVIGMAWLVPAMGHPALGHMLMAIGP